MKDQEFLKWIEARLIQVHGESPNVDYMHKLRAIIKSYDPDQNSPNIASMYRPSDMAEPYYLYRVPGVPATGSWLKRLLCLHDWLLKFNRGVESEFECAKCGKSEVRRLAYMY